MLRRRIKRSATPVARAMRHLEQRDARVGSLFGAHPGSVVVRDDVDLTSPVLDYDERIVAFADRHEPQFGLKWAASASAP